MAHLGQRRVRPPVGERESIDAELAVVEVRVWPEVTAVGVARRAIGHGLLEPLIAPVPDEPALDVRMRAEEVPVLVQSAIRVAHRVRILA